IASLLSSPCLPPAAPPTAISPLSLHDALPISLRRFFQLELESGRLRELDAELLARMLMGSLHHFVMGEVIAGGPVGHLSAEQYRSEEHTSELQSRFDLVCRLLLAKKNRRRTKA